MGYQIGCQSGTFLCPVFFQTGTSFDHLIKTVADFYGKNEETEKNQILNGLRSLGENKTDL